MWLSTISILTQQIRRQPAKFLGRYIRKCYPLAAKTKLYLPIPIYHHDHQLFTSTNTYNTDRSTFWYYININMVINVAIVTIIIIIIITTSINLMIARCDKADGLMIDEGKILNCWPRQWTLWEYETDTAWVWWMKGTCEKIEHAA